MCPQWQLRLKEKERYFLFIYFNLTHIHITIYVEISFILFQPKFLPPIKAVLANIYPTQPVLNTPTRSSLARLSCRGPDLVQLSICVHLDTPRLDLVWPNWVQLGYSANREIPWLGPVGGKYTCFSLFFYFYILLLILISNFFLLICRWMSRQLQKLQLIH